MVAPKLRFPEFDENWNKQRLDNFLERVSNPVDVIADQQYTQIGIRSHGKGIFHKEAITGEELGNKRVFWIEPNALIVNIVFAWERAIAVTSDAEKGMIASHRFPMYLPKNNLSNVDFLRYFFLTDKGQTYLELASPGGAGRNKTLGQSNFAELKIDLPILEEQTKIASFLSAVDEKINQLTQKHQLLSQYKQGMMQKLFSQQIRFKADDGSEFAKWEETVLEKIGTFLKGKGISKADIVENGFTPCIRYGELYTHYGEVISKVISATNLEIENLILSKANDVLIPASGETQIDIATASCVLHDDVAISGDLNIFRTKENGVFLSYLIRSHLKMQIAQLAQGNSVVHLYSSQLKGVRLNLPCLEEQIKIANFLSSIDQKIDVVSEQLEQAKLWKKGLLQQMFV